MATTIHSYKNLTWIDVVSPTENEVDLLVEQYAIPKPVGRELLINTRRSRSDVYNSCAYLVLHFPKKEGHVGSRKTLHEIDFVIMPETLITTRYSGDRSMQEFAELFDNKTLTPDIEDVGALVHQMIEKLYGSFEYDLERIGKLLENIEEKIFSGQEKEVVHSLSLLGRELADFKKALGYHEEALEEIASSGQSFLGESFAHHLRSIIGDYRRTRHQLTGEESFFEELRQTNNSLLAIKQNEVIKTLTIIAFITFPLTLIAGIFGMNTVGAPITGHMYDFWIIIIIMATLSVLMYSFFKYRRWL